ncbi:MAG: citramalate synthase [Endomicrobiales bacterium]|nr:citramalate synthase [Endomicrobiales bacterium]
MRKIELFDTTLRDGSQGAGISFSVEDSLKIAKALDEFGMHYIEGGWPGSNPKAEEFFNFAKKIKFKNSKLVAFGSTRHKSQAAAQDKNLLAIVNSGVPVACIFGKTWDMHVKYALNATLDENLDMISESVAFLRKRGLEVVYDAEHFFDGYINNPEYALKTLDAASCAGAQTLCLCETNGGMLPNAVRNIVREVAKVFPNIKLGIHTHNDSDCAVANTIIAVQEGCSMVQGTVNGLGERCGNANLMSIIPALQLKLGMQCVKPGKLIKLTELALYVDEIANIAPNDRQPYVGRNAFAHKAGIHVSAVAKNSKTYEHITPFEVGNERKVLVSELSGRSNLAFKAKEFSLDFDKDPKAAASIIKLVKEYEKIGYQFEDAEASFILLAQKELGRYKPSFILKSFKVSVEIDARGNLVSEASVKIDVNGKEEHCVAEGDGPVNALDNSLRKALRKHYPQIDEVTLVDFKVRVINSGAGTASKVRTFVESRDSNSMWGTVGVSENIIEASWEALADALEYKIMKINLSKRRKIGGKNAQ